MQRRAAVPLVLAALAGCGGDEPRRPAPALPDDAVSIPGIGVVDPRCEGEPPYAMTFRAPPGSATVSVVVEVGGRRVAARDVHPGGRLRVVASAARWTFVQRTQPHTVRATLRLRLGHAPTPRPECSAEEARLAVRTRWN